MFHWARARSQESSRIEWQMLRICVTSTIITICYHMATLPTSLFVSYEYASNKVTV